MFTGIVEERGEIVAREDLSDSARFTVRGPLVTVDAAHGDSIAVNGVCLTVVGQPRPDRFTVDVMGETLARSSLSMLTVGAQVNLERAMPAGGRFGGHVVQGHVDDTGKVLGITPSQHWRVVRIGVSEILFRYIVEKGSITIDGVSLTVSAVSTAGIDEPWFEVSLIPTTVELTTLGALVVGDTVNLEADIIAKYVEKMTAPRQSGAADVAMRQ